MLVDFCSTDIYKCLYPEVIMILNPVRCGKGLEFFKGFFKCPEIAQIKMGNIPGSLRAAR